MIVKPVRLLLFASALLNAGGLGGPVPGWTLDSRTATIRAVMGIPGGLRLGDPLQIASGIAAVEFSSSGEAAVAITTEQPAHLLVIQKLSSAPTTVDLGELAEGSRILALNRKGTAAAFYSESAQAVRFLTALDGTPALSDPVSTAALAGPVTAGLLEDSGTCAVLGSGSVETLCADGASRRVVQETGMSVTALALGISGRDLWISDAAGKQVLRVNSYAQQPVAMAVASEADGILRPVALACAPSGEILAADADAQAIFVFGANDNSLHTVPLNVAPSRLRPLTDPSLFLINDLSSLPFTLFASGEMRTYFVPAN